MVNERLPVRTRPADPDHLADHDAVIAVAKSTARDARDVAMKVYAPVIGQSPFSPDDIRAAAEVHQELGPDYSDAVVASSSKKVDREIAARVEARMAGTSRAEPAKPNNRRTLVKGMAIGAAAVALVVAVVAGRSGQAASIHVAPKAHAGAHQIPAPPAPGAPAAP